MAKQKKNTDPNTKDRKADTIDELARQRAFVESQQKDSQASLELQRQYVEDLGADLGGMGLVNERAIMESMRDVGYTNTAFALAEHVDNSIQAGATEIHIAIETGKGNVATELAVIDNGHGMDPPMIQVAVALGGTHRHLDTEGFGKYGVGLTQAAISQGRRFTVFSMPDGGAVHSVEVDLDDIAEKAAAGQIGKIRPLAKNEKERPVPTWVTKAREANTSTAFDHGTIVLIGKLDQTTWRRRGDLQRHLIELLGMIYRYPLLTDGVRLFVGETEVRGIDPLFTLPGHYDPAQADDDIRAEDAGRFDIPVKDPASKKIVGNIRVRCAFLPRTFPRRDKAKGVGSRGQNGNYRWDIIGPYNKGYHILREGRQIQFYQTKFHSSQKALLTNDRYWGVEIDFDASLDFLFRVNTSKQQVIPTDRVWEILMNAGVPATIDKMKKMFKDEKAAEVKEKAPKINGQSRSAHAAGEARRKFSRKSQQKFAKQNQERADKNRQRLADKQSKQTGVDIEVIDEQLQEDIKKRAYHMDMENIGRGMSFFTANTIGANGSQQIVVVLNKDHAFYHDVYTAAATSDEVRDAIDVLLFAIADSWVNGSEHEQAFYETAVANWSQSLAQNLHELEANPAVTADDGEIDEG